MEISSVRRKTADSSRKPCAWLVEDSPLEAEVARRAIGAHYQLEVFADATMMLERMANSESPDILILDWQLPGMTGIEVCRFLRASLDEMALPILMLTVHGHKPDIVEGLSAGANDYLTKPYDAAELLARVNTLSRTRALYKELTIERKRLETVFTALPAYVVLCQGPEHVIRFMNPALRAALGHLPCDNQPFFSSCPGLGLDAHRSRWDSVYRTGKPTHLDELPLRPGEPRDGQEPRYLSWSLVPHPQSSREIAGVLAFATDVTEQVRSRRAQEDLLVERERLLREAQQAWSRAEQANRSKDDFLATVSHELRTPLNAISGWVNLLRSGSLGPDKLDRALETIHRNAEAQTQLINDLLDVSRIISGNLNLNLEPVDWLPIVEMAVEAVKPAADAKSVRLETHLSSDAHPIVADAARLQQVVWNLLTNAVKFTPQGGHVLIKLTREGDDAELSVKDTGQGMDPEFLPYIFDRFRQADATPARSHGGLGLGLAIVRHLVELHGGSVSAHSTGLGQGSCFSVKIPISLDRVKTPGSPSSSPAVVSGSQALQGLRVLCVDDEADSRELLSTVLGNSGAEVQVVSSAAQAIAAFDERPPDLLISDVGMPTEDGLSLIRKIRARGSERGGRTPAIALTAYAHSEDRTRALRAGFNIHMSKPVDLSEFLVVIASLVGRFSSG